MSLQDRRFYQENCWRCSQCKFVPLPQEPATASICPSIDHGNFHAFSAGGKVVTSYALMESKAKVTPMVVESVYACTMCGACDTACKTNTGDLVEPLDTLYALREHLAANGHVPPAQAALVGRLRREGSHHGPASERDKWAKELALKDATREPVQVLLHVGGSNAHDPAQWPQLRALATLLQRAGIHFGTAGSAETDAGGLAYDLGFQDDARRIALKTLQQVKASRATILLSACATDYAAYRNLYPRMGVVLDGVRIVHATDFIEELLAQGKLELAARHAGTVTYHDPCRLGRLSEPYTPWKGEWITVMNTMLVTDSPRHVNFGNEGNYEAPRRLLQRIEGLRLVEMPRNRHFAYCCGAGAGAAEAYPEMAGKAALSRLQEAQATGASCVVTACAGCQRHLKAVAKEHSLSLEIHGVLELLAEGTSA